MAPKQFKTLNRFFFFETKDLKKKIYYLETRLLNLD